MSTTMTAQIFVPSLRLSGHKRPNTFDVRIETHCPRENLLVTLYDAIGGVIEQLEPGQKIWQIEFVISLKYGAQKPDVINIKMPGREFLKMARAGIYEMGEAMLVTVKRFDDKNERLRIEALYAAHKIENPCIYRSPSKNDINKIMAALAAIRKSILAPGP